MSTPRADRHFRRPALSSRKDGDGQGRRHVFALGHLEAEEDGTATGQTTDGWGATSNVALWIVRRRPKSIRARAISHGEGFGRAPSSPPRAVRGPDER